MESPVATVLLAGNLDQPAARPNEAHSVGVRTRARRFRPTPLVFVVIALAVKFAVAGALLRQTWWMPFHTTHTTFNEPFPGFYAGTATLGCLLLLLAPATVVSRALEGWLLAISYLVMSLVMMADRIHVRYFGVIFPIRRLGQYRMLRELAMGTATEWDFRYLWFLADAVPVVLLLSWLATRRDTAATRSHTLRRALWAVAIGGVLLLPSARLVCASEGLTDSTVAQGELPTLIGVLPYHLLDAIRTVLAGTTPEHSPRPDELAAFVQGTRQQVSQPGSTYGVASGLNVIQISAESLQGFPIGLTVDGQVITPRLNRLADESLYFERFFDQTSIGTTSDAELLTNQSLHPLADAFVADSFANNQWRGTAERLREQGYKTISACGAPAGFWHMDAMHRAFGFSESWFDGDYPESEKTANWSWISDRDFLRQTADKLATQPAPFYAYLLTSSNHDPFDVPASERTLDLRNIHDQRLSNYLHSVHAFDTAFGAFLDRLAANGLLERTVIVVYGDHQAFLEDSPEYARLLGLSSEDDFGLWQNRKRLPLMIRLPGTSSRRHMKNAGGHIDVAPTILSLLGVDTRGEVMLGHDLSGGASDTVVFRDGSFVDGVRYFLNNAGPIERSRCYDFETHAPLSCAPAKDQQGLARRRLAMSDEIVTRDLIPSIRAHANVVQR